MHTPSPDTQAMLDALKNAVATALEKKRQLGKYAIIWHDNKPVIIGDDAPKDRMPL